MTAPDTLTLPRFGKMDLEQTCVVLWSPKTGNVWREPYMQTFSAGRRAFLDGQRNAAWILMGIFRNDKEAADEVMLLEAAQNYLRGQRRAPFDNFLEEP